MTEVEEQQRLDRDRAARAAVFAVDTFVLDRLAGARITEASRSRLIVDAALGYLIGAGLITVTPEAEWPEWLALQIPEHLRPDVQAATDELARVNQSVGARPKREPTPSEVADGLDRAALDLMRLAEKIDTDS